MSNSKRIILKSLGKRCAVSMCLLSTTFPQSFLHKGLGVQLGRRKISRRSVAKSRDGVSQNLATERRNFPRRFFGASAPDISQMIYCIFDDVNFTLTVVPSHTVFY